MGCVAIILCSCKTTATAQSMQPQTVVYDVYPGPAQAISDAVAQANPGDRIQLHPGVYTGTVEISRRGAPERPIVISGRVPGSSEWAMIDGGAEPGMGLHNEAFRIADSSWIRIEDLDIENCWTDVFVLQDSSYISVVRCAVDGGRTMVAAHGAASHHILVEGCAWIQDELVYTTWPWVELHHGAYKYYNGGIYGGSDAAGSAVIRGNDVGYVFNGLRWWMSDEDAVTQRAQSNIEIYDNDFHHARDNIIEPERYAWNLQIYHNRMDSCPRGVFSIDKVLGGNINVYGNTGRWERDGAIEEKPWTIYKFHNYRPEQAAWELTSPLNIYNNSWSYTYAFVPSSSHKANDNVIHYNNAYVFVNATSSMGLIDWWGKDCIFDYDMAAAPWHADLIADGYEQHGYPDTDPDFVSEPDNDFRLSAGSPAIDAGRVIDGFTLWYLGDGPDIGAYEGDMRVYGMPFYYQTPPGGDSYVEKPRIVRVFSKGSKLALFFSTDLDESTLSEDTLSITANDGTSLDIQEVSFPVWGRVAVLQLEDPLPAAAEDLDIEFITLPKSTSGADATLWASDLRIVRIPQNAVLTPDMATLFSESGS